MNRLNFAQMVNKNILGHQENKFFNISQINTEDFYEQKSYTAKIKEAQERLNLERKINNIVFHVHEKLRERQVSPKKFKPKPIKKISIENITQEKQLKILKSSEDQTISSVFEECKELSIPRLKVLQSDKKKKRLHKSTKANSNNFENHKKIIGALRRQNELENMLEEQQLIKQNRQSIAQDIFALRHCLDDIQHRVNNSLKHLENKKTYCECHGLMSAKNCKKCLGN